MLAERACCPTVLVKNVEVCPVESLNLGPVTSCPSCRMQGTLWEN